MVWEIDLTLLGVIVLVIFGAVCVGGLDRVIGGGDGTVEGGQKKWYG